MSDSWTELIRRYMVSRLPMRLYLPCAVLLVIAALAGGQLLIASQLVMAVFLAFSLLCQFRLMDDIYDLPLDRQRHPERVLVRAHSLRPMWAWLVLCCLINLALLSRQPGPAYRPTVFLLLTAASFLWYRRLRKKSVFSGRVLGYHVVAGKYPAFVFLLSGNSGREWSVALAMALVYLSFTIYEVLHDRSLQAFPTTEISLRLEIGLLFVVSVLMTFDLIGGDSTFVALQGVLGAVGFLILGEAFVRRRMHDESVQAGYCVFVIVFALCVNFSLGVRL